MKSENVGYVAFMVPTKCSLARMCGFAPREAHRDPSDWIRIIDKLTTESIPVLTRLLNLALYAIDKYSNREGLRMTQSSYWQGIEANVIPTKLFTQSQLHVVKTLVEEIQMNRRNAVNALAQDIHRNVSVAIPSEYTFHVKLICYLLVFQLPELGWSQIRCYLHALNQPQLVMRICQTWCIRQSDQDPPCQRVESVLCKYMDYKFAKELSNRGVGCYAKSMKQYVSVLQSDPMSSKLEHVDRQRGDSAEDNGKLANPLFSPTLPVWLPQPAMLNCLEHRESNGNPTIPNLKLAQTNNNVHVEAAKLLPWSNVSMVQSEDNTTVSVATVHLKDTISSSDFFEKCKQKQETFKKMRESLIRDQRNRESELCRKNEFSARPLPEHIYNDGRSVVEIRTNRAFILREKSMLHNHSSLDTSIDENVSKSLPRHRKTANEIELSRIRMDQMIEEKRKTNKSMRDVLIELWNERHIQNERELDVKRKRATEIHNNRQCLVKQARESIVQWKIRCYEKMKEMKRTMQFRLAEEINEMNVRRKMNCEVQQTLRRENVNLQRQSLNAYDPTVAMGLNVLSEMSNEELKIRLKLKKDEDARLIKMRKMKCLLRRAKQRKVMIHSLHYIRRERMDRAKQRKCQFSKNNDERSK